MSELTLNYGHASPQRLETCRSYNDKSGMSLNYANSIHQPLFPPTFISPSLTSLPQLAIRYTPSSIDQSAKILN